MVAPTAFGYSDLATNADTFAAVYKIDFNTVTAVVSNVNNLELSGGSTMTDNQFRLTGNVAADPAVNVNPANDLTNDVEYVGESVGIYGAFRDYLNTTYGAGAWQAAYTGFSTAEADARPDAGPPDTGLDQPIIAINFAPDENADPPREGGIDYFVLSSSADPLKAPVDGNIADYAPYYYSCFEKNTQISTPSGYVPVSSLKVGDEVLNHLGQAIEVLWVGRQVLNPVFAKVHGGMPVKISAGALGANVPQADLYVSPDHAFLIDGLLVNASALVNGSSIVQMQSWPGNLEYYHIETDAHEIILAEGALAETYLDNEGRQKFANYDEFQQMYPNGKTVKELDMPRIKHVRQLPSQIKNRLSQQAQQIGLALEQAA